ncbi:C10 family peptidase [bacterium]|nr:C10 family peptidase [bacterium]
MKPLKKYFPKFLFICIVLLIPAQLLLATNSDKTNIKKIAKGWLRTCPAYVRAEHDKKPYKVRNTVTDVMSQDGSEIIAHVVELDPAGYVIISPDDRMNPVIAYSLESGFDGTEDRENLLLELLRADIPERRRALTDGAVPQEKIRNAQSKRQTLEAAGDDGVSLQAASPIRLNHDVEYGPFMTSKWGQDTDYWNRPVYNYYTPLGPDGSGSNYVCGCVATCMGQVLNYYEWPPRGTGTYSYTWNNTVDPSRVLSVDYGAATYDWANILDEYLYASTSTEAQRQAAGLLTYHCGVSVDMFYTSGGSGAYSMDVETALQYHFRMAAEFLDSTATFFTRLYENMVRGRPAMLSVRRIGGGHCITVDGVRHDDGEQPYYHINLGWDGYGYYPGDPDNAEGWYNLEEPIRTTGNTYHLIADAIVDILPLPMIPDLPSDTASPDIDVEWQASTQLNETAYDLQMASLSDDVTNFTDPVDDQMIHWTPTDNWEVHSGTKYSTPYSIHGFISKTLDDLLIFGTLTSNEAIGITASTAMNYMWYAYHMDGVQVRLEISRDGEAWDVLKSHTAHDQTWIPVSISTADLTAYHNDTVMLRWVIEYLGGSYWYGSGPGFYFDDFTVNNAYIGSFETVSDDDVAENQTVSVDVNGDYAFRVRPQSDGQWWSFSNFETVTVNALPVGARVFIEGPYSVGEDCMITDVNGLGYLPQNSPYTEAPAFCESIPDSIVDWVLVELRTDPEGPAVEQRSALLSYNGYICNTTGTQGVLFDADDGSYYIVIRHRNHMPVMSADPVSLAR